MHMAILCHLCHRPHQVWDTCLGQVDGVFSICSPLVLPGILKEQEDRARRLPTSKVRSILGAAEGWRPASTLEPHGTKVLPRAQDGFGCWEKCCLWGKCLKVGPSTPLAVFQTFHGLQRWPPPGPASSSPVLIPHCPSRLVSWWNQGEEAGHGLEPEG